jgi:hypothetical protein
VRRRRRRERREKQTGTPPVKGWKSVEHQFVKFGMTHDHHIEELSDTGEKREI